jgi:hypothetical protein
MGVQPSPVSLSVKFPFSGDCPSFSVAETKYLRLGNSKRIEVYFGSRLWKLEVQDLAGAYAVS